MRTRQDLEISNQSLASGLESPTGSGPILSVAPCSVTGLEEVRRSNIRELAYGLYEDRGRVDGYDLDDWLEAEAIFQEKGKLVA